MVRADFEARLAAYDRLTPAQQTVARQVFTRLTATTSDGADTIARTPRAAPVAGRSTAAELDTEAVLESFASERLLTLGADTVEISHEILLSAWPMLRDIWLADTHADRIVRTRLHATAEDWSRRPGSFLPLHRKPAWSGREYSGPDRRRCPPRAAEPGRPPMISDKGPVTSVAFSPDGANLAIGTWEGAVALWAVGDRQYLSSTHKRH